MGGICCLSKKVLSGKHLAVLRPLDTLPVCESETPFSALRLDATRPGQEPCDGAHGESLRSPPYLDLVTTAVSWPARQLWGSAWGGDSLGGLEPC